MGKFPKYKLNYNQIRGLACIVGHEQGSVEGMYAEASLIANRTDIKGDRFATVENIISMATSGWFAYGRKRYNAGYKGTENVSKTAIAAVEDCIVKGKRVLPRYVNEHDCLSDIKSVTNGTKKSKENWSSHKTIITNRYGSTWFFYSYPGGIETGVDPFGYTSKTYRDKYGEFYYTLDQAMDDDYEGEPEGYRGIFPVLPDKSFGVSRTWYQFGDGDTTLKIYKTQIRRTQMLLNWALDINLETGTGKYLSKTVSATKELQRRAGTDANGKFGKKCLEYCKNLKK